MGTAELRKHLHSQIEHLDEKSLEAMYSIFQDYFGSDTSFKLTENHKNLIDERLESYEKNPRNVINWEESSRLIKKYL